MGVIENADILEIENRGRYCTLWLDEYPKDLRVKDDCLIGGIVFTQVPVHYNFHDAKKQMETAYIAIDLKDLDLSADWFIGQQVEPV